MPSRRRSRAASETPRRTLGGTRLVADAMLGSLARKLRAFGFDTAYFSDGDDTALLELARTQGRVLLTSDRSLAETAAARRIPTVIIRGDRESSRLSSLRSTAVSAGIGLDRGPARCSVCNGELARTGRAGAVGRVPGGVLRRHRLFYECQECGRFYWKGSHWKKLRSLERRLG